MHRRTGSRASKDPVLLSDYQSAWADRFFVLGRDLRAALGDVAGRIDHIGSTAVVGMAAKPIVDVQVSVAALDPPEAFRVPLERLGFVFRPDNADRSKRYFRESPGAVRTHIHVRRSGSWAEQAALLFRDFLRCHPEEARDYQQVKRELAARHRHDRAAYSEGKSEFVWQCLRRADRWSQATGWSPGESDA